MCWECDWNLEKEVYREFYYEIVWEAASWENRKGI
jgi:hypothetical protein